jgi:hypothetical protein
MKLSNSKANAKIKISLFILNLIYITPLRLCKFTMKKIITLAFIIFITAHLQAQTADTTKKDPDKYIELVNGDHDMGKIPPGKALEYNVYIRNISTDTLVIQEVRVICGCTTPKYKTADKILPGMSTYITLGFNGSANGEFAKSADIIFTNGMVKPVKFHGIAANP